VKLRKTPATISASSAAALLLGAWCGSALASADVQAPGPELAAHTETSLHEILSDDEIASPTIRTLESTAEQDEAGENEDLTTLKSDAPEMTTRLPGVSSSDSPRFRRHMYRTDI
jgi:hypothetical protein